MPYSDDEPYCNCSPCPFGCGEESGLLNVGMNMINSNSFDFYDSDENSALLILLLGCKINNIKIVNETLMNIQSVTEDYVRAISQIFVNSNADIKKCIISKLCDESTFCSFIESVCQSNNFDTLKIIFEKILANDTKFDINNGRILNLVCGINNLQIVKFFVENGLKLKNCKFGDLRVLLQTNNLSMLNYFIEQGININVECSEYSGQNLLTAVCHMNNIPMLKILFENGIGIGSEVNQLACLRGACNNCNNDMINFLLGHGLNINSNDDYGNIIKYYARHSILVKFLLEKGATPNISILYTSLRTNDFELLDLIFKSGFELTKDMLNLKDTHGIIALRCINSSSMAKFLIDRGIDLESKCEKYSSGKEYLTAKKIYPY